MSQQILPFYLVCDESGSMSGEPIEAINKALPELHSEIGSNPVVTDKTRFCLIGFSSRAEILLPLSDLSTVTEIPALQASGGTDYAKAFDVLRETINDDVNTLKAQGHQVFRPAVFFLSDGLPANNGWEGAYRALTDPGWRPRPNILAFGFGQADQQTIQQVATTKAFMANGQLGPAQALQEFAKSLIRSIVNSGTQSASDQTEGATLVMPAEVPGFTTITAEAL
ncbi:vWA domain-containing protein [Catenuloplanes japonicus]|uniref:vWA domain-containing protein n=1 Tax=Catenuloplanes japonicus TaxID=33876 RepID=UPI0005270CA2|nr:VWA domain-containing protein [Catenuloplanes japonicus]